ncbi:MAG: hypothetical protein NVS3B21_14940 [Acidimicrobiales bacterium]
MAMIRERSPGVWQVTAFTGRNADGRPTQVAVSGRGGKRDALREPARLESAPQRGAEGRTVADAMRAWLERNEGSCTPATLRDQTSGVRLVEGDQIAQMPLARLKVADVDRWLTRMRRAGLGESTIRNRMAVLRAALQQAVVWGWISANIVTLAKLGPHVRPVRRQTPAKPLATQSWTRPAGIFSDTLTRRTRRRRRRGSAR